MSLKEGDYLVIDGSEYQVDAYYPPDSYILKETDVPVGYYYMNFKNKAELDDLFAKGRLQYGRRNGTQGGHPSCFHLWKKYVGFREVYEYCTKCDAKNHKKWTEIKDEKEY